MSRHIDVPIDYFRSGSKNQPGIFSLHRDTFPTAFAILACPRRELRRFPPALGDRASSIGREGKPESPDERLERYLKHLPRSRGAIIPGRNVLPYESTDEFVTAVSEFTRSI